MTVADKLVSAVAVVAAADKAAAAAVASANDSKTREPAADRAEGFAEFW